MKPINSFLGDLQGIIDKEGSEVITIQEKYNVDIRQLLFRHVVADCYVYALSLKLDQEQLFGVTEDCISKINADDIRKHPVEAYNWAVSAVNEALNSLFEKQCKGTVKEEDAIAYLKSLGYTVKKSVDRKPETQKKPVDRKPETQKKLDKETQDALKLLSSLADMGLF